MAKVIAVCLSEKKGTIKTQKDSVKLIENYGIENDAHAGNWHRQVSLLSFESFEKFKDDIKIDLDYGVFGENILISGLNLRDIKIGQIIKIKEVELEITQKGKKCHKSCEIRNIVGNCIMPNEGVFSVVKKGGVIKKGDEVCLI